MRKFIITFLVALVALPAAAQLKLPRPSPKASLMQTAGLTDITITYSRPGVKGRQIWGALVPFDKVWRTGANEATTITFSDDVMVSGMKLAKGTYSLHTIPGRDEWTVIVNSVADQWGSYSYDEAKDVVRLKVKPEKGEHREWMTFEIPEMTTDTAKIVLRWENVAVPFTVDTMGKEKALAGIRKTLESSKNDAWLIPYRAADFALQNDMMTEAQSWLDESMRAKETMANLWLKARMQAKMGKKADAVRTAEMALAKATDDDRDFASEIRKNADLWKK